jgi:hypothetical protein
MIGWHRRGHHYRAYTRQVSRIVTLSDTNAESSEIRCSGKVHVTASHGNPSAEGDQCQGTHPCAADSHEVDTAFIRGVEQGHV